MEICDGLHEVLLQPEVSGDDALDRQWSLVGIARVAWTVQNGCLGVPAG